MILKPKIEAGAGAGMELLEVALRNPGYFGKTLGEVMTALPAGVQIVALRRAHHNEPASPAFVVAEDDVMLVVGPTKEMLAQAARALGEAAPGRFVKDRSDLDYVRVFASRPMVVGRAIGDLELPGDKAAIIGHVRRGDTDIMPRPDLDARVRRPRRPARQPRRFPGLRKFFGDSIKGTAEVQLHLDRPRHGDRLPDRRHPAFRSPASARWRSGFSGVLIVALVLGNLRRTGGMNWTMPLSANMVLFNLGLTLFLAQAGMSTGREVRGDGCRERRADPGARRCRAGGDCAAGDRARPVRVQNAVRRNGGHARRRDCGNPAILAYANKLAPTDRPDIGYAMIFPSMTILKILFVNIAAALM